MMQVSGLSGVGHPTVGDDGIAWLLKNYPELADPQICKLIGTTKPTIDSTACARDCACSLAMIFATWNLAVCAEMPSTPPISRIDLQTASYGPPTCKTC